MEHRTGHGLDVAVIGGGPAGISACLELSGSSGLRVGLFESEADLGGIPRTCHAFFGFRDLKRVYTGPGYARRLSRLVRESSVKIHPQSTVTRIHPGVPGGLHQLDVMSSQGLNRFETRFVLLATGCYETSREGRQLPGTRPSGIFTTGALQKNIYGNRRIPGNRAVIIGSEHVSFLALHLLRHTGVHVVALVEEDRELQSYPFMVCGMTMLYGVPIHKGMGVKAILGDERVEGVELIRNVDQKVFHLACDTVVVTGRFRPDSALIYNTPIELDSLTGGPLVDMELMTTVPDIFAAGNVLRGADMHDLCALEGEKAAQSIIRREKALAGKGNGAIPITVEPPIRYVVPQKIIPSQRRPRPLPWFFPGYTIQTERTLRSPVLEAWSGDRKIWERSFSRLIGRYRVNLPVERFDWSRVDPEMGIVVRLRKGRLRTPTMTEVEG